MTSISRRYEGQSIRQSRAILTFLCKPGNHGLHILKQRSISSDYTQMSPCQARGQPITSAQALKQARDKHSSSTSIIERQRKSASLIRQ